MQYKSFGFESKVDTSKREFEGYASCFHNIDHDGDIVEPGSFTKTLQERLPKKAIKILWQHSEPLGMPMLMQEDGKGLHVIGKISKTRLGDEALELMSDGVVNTMSIGYEVIKDEWDYKTADGANRRVRRLKELKLYEVSPVTFPANELATIESVKQLNQMKNFSPAIMLDFLLHSELGKAIDLTEEMKAGRMLSQSSVGKIRSAIQALQALLDAVEPEKSTQDVEKSLKNNDVNPDEIQLILQEIKKLKGVE